MINDYIIVNADNAYALMGKELYEIKRKVVSLGLINFMSISSEKILFQVMSGDGQNIKINIPFESSIFYVKP
jgi:hypothetical protein